MDQWEESNLNLIRHIIKLHSLPLESIKRNPLLFLDKNMSNKRTEIITVIFLWKLSFQIFNNFGRDATTVKISLGDNILVTRQCLECCNYIFSVNFIFFDASSIFDKLLFNVIFTCSNLISSVPSDNFKNRSSNFSLSIKVPSA